MTASEIAERFSLKPGYRLIDYMEVGLPVYHVVLQASTLLRKKIPPLEEFVMRCLKFGMRDCEEVSSFLGLQLPIVEGVATSLIRDDDVCLAGVPGDRYQTLKLTAKGNKSIEELETVVPEERTISLHFDALLRKPAFFRELLLKFRELKDQGLKEIPAVPPRQPKPTDFPINQVQELIKTVMGAGEKRDLLTIKRVERCNRLFRRAVALLYRSVETGDRRVEFVVDGRLTSDYAIAFAKADGLKILGVEVSDVSAAAADLGVQGIVHPEFDLGLQDGSLEKQTDAILDAQAEIKGAEEAIQETTDAATRQELEKQLKEAKARLAELEARQSRRGVRQVYVYEHPRLLERAMNSCVERLMIISPWIRAQVVDQDFIRRLREALKRGAKVYIGYGLPNRGPAEDIRKSDRQAEEKLAGLCKYPNFFFQKFGDTHAKVLICDSKFCVTGSFNWLSFKGDPDRTFRDEQSVLVELPEHIEGVFRENLKRFEAQPSQHDRH